MCSPILLFDFASGWSKTALIFKCGTSKRSPKVY